MHRKHIHCYCQQQDLSLNVGDILLIPPNMLHKIICQEEGTRFIFLINIDSFSNLEDYHTLDPVLWMLITALPLLSLLFIRNFMLI